MVKKWVIFALLTLFLVLPAHALLDSGTTQSSKDIVAGTLLIVTDKETTYKRGNDIFLHVEVFNYTGLLLNGTSTDCFLNFYNFSNFPLITSKMDEFYYNGFNFTLPSNLSSGVYGYDIWCNSTSLVGGVISTQLEINEQGSTTPQGYLTISITIALIIIFIILYYLYLSKTLTLEAFNKNAMIKIMFFLISLWMLLIPINFASYLSDNFIGSAALTSTITIMYITVISLNVFITTLFFLSILIIAVKSLQVVYKR